MATLVKSADKVKAIRNIVCMQINFRLNKIMLSPIIYYR